MDRTSNTQFSSTGEGPRSQFGALCWRRADTGIEVLLITSRDTGRWVIPKGWPIDGLGPAGSAAREAWEEAGVKGDLAQQPVGFFSYDKGIAPDETLPCVVSVFPLHVTSLADRFPERKERRRKWFSPEKAARKVAEPELQCLLTDLAKDATSLALPASDPTP
jgi:8-oxo-dGTP pyrophosphatase MutT (NUDIX family)